MAAYESYLDFRKSSFKHLRDAQELLEAPSREPEVAGSRHRHLRGAWYLAGYSIECALKAHLIASHCDLSKPALATLSAAEERLSVPGLRTARGHHLSWLYGLTNLDERLPTDREFRRQLGLAQHWTHTMRYDPTVPDAQDCRDYVDAVEVVPGRIMAQAGL